MGNGISVSENFLLQTVNVSGFLYPKHLRLLFGRSCRLKLTVRHRWIGAKMNYSAFSVRKRIVSLTDLYHENSRARLRFVSPDDLRASKSFSN